jgi:hypothetical protein
MNEIVYICKMVLRFYANHEFQKDSWVKPGNSHWRGKLSTVDLLSKVACFGKKKIMNEELKSFDMSLLVQGSQLPYWSFPFCKD